MLGIASFVSAQTPHKPTIVDAKLDLKGHVIEGPYVLIKYYIPYNGMVEIRLFNNEGEKIWQGQYAHVHGENVIRLRAEKFHPGEVYNYTLNYKTDQVSESLVVPFAGSE